MNDLPKGRQAEYTLLDMTMSLARRCEHYDHKLGPPQDSSRAELHPEWWLLVRTAEMVRKAQRGCLIREGRL